MAPKKASPQKSKSDGISKSSLFNIFDKNHIWTDKDEVLDAVYWYRQVLAFIMGVIWGIFGLTGSFGIVAFIILNSLAAYSIGNNTGYDFDPDDQYSSVKEGFMTTFATFLVTWIVSYTAIHFNY